MNDDEIARLESRYVKCICPKCNKSHKKKMIWIGRGTPKKFCKQCSSNMPKYTSDEELIIGFTRCKTISSSEGK